MADAHVASGKTLSRIACGSCAKQSKDQPIWNAVNAAEPDLFIFLGDNIYADTRDPKVMADKYAGLRHLGRSRLWRGRRRRRLSDEG